MIMEGDNVLAQTPFSNGSDGIKITNVVYRVLDFLPDSDPLKNRAKEKTLAILENLTLISKTQGWVSLQKEKAKAQVLDDIGVLESYLNIAKSQGWIDSINFLIIVKEYHRIKSTIKPPKGLIRQSMEIAYNVVGDQTKVLPSVGSLAKDRQEPSIRKEILVLAEKYSERQRKILEILHEREKAQVSDFIKELPNITKRTIRRDLDDLLKKGKIVRVGEWNQVFYKGI